jgi:hypothetical protein
MERGCFTRGAGIGNSNIEQVISVGGQPADYHKHRDSDSGDEYCKI